MNQIDLNQMTDLELNNIFWKISEFVSINTIINVLKYKIDKEQYILKTRIGDLDKALLSSLALVSDDRLGKELKTKLNQNIVDVINTDCMSNYERHFIEKTKDN
jgi:hypothetical protein